MWDLVWTIEDVQRKLGRREHVEVTLDCELVVRDVRRRWRFELVFWMVKGRR